MKWLAVIAVALPVAIIGALEYTNNPMYKSLKAKYIPSAKGNFSISDFYQPKDTGKFNDITGTLHRRKLSSEAWANEKIKYALLTQSLATKIDELNDLTDKDAEFGNGKLLKVQLVDIAQELNDLEGRYTQEALLEKDDSNE